MSLYEFRDRVKGGDILDKEELGERVEGMLKGIGNEHHVDANREYVMRIEKNRSNPFHSDDEKKEGETTVVGNIFFKKKKNSEKADRESSTTA